MPEYISGNPMMVKVLLENMLEDAGIIRLMHDGGIEGSQIYTRKYGIFLRGKDTHATMKFIYNKRDNWADISISEYNLLNIKFKQMLKGIVNDRIQVYAPKGNSQARAGDEKTRRGDDSPQPQRLPTSL